MLLRTLKSVTLLVSTACVLRAGEPFEVSLFVWHPDYRLIYLPQAIREAAEDYLGDFPSGSFTAWHSRRVYHPVRSSRDSAQFLLRADPLPNMSIEVDDVDAVHAKALELGLPIVYPITNEPWGVRRFFVADPNGVIINVLSHRK
jgi:catechol 2,3-dioxygenase-like lactoylglutathione lyase family enzyme